MTAYPTWTPAPKPGIIPLHPLTFGTILGRSFSALRHNPRVLLGFALGVQTIAYIVLILGIGGIGWLTFSRLDTAIPGSDDYEAIFAGSTLITGLAGLALGLLATALQVVVQAVVVVEVAHATVAERLRIGAIWRQVRPVLWRLIGYAALLLVAIGAVTALVIALLAALAAAGGTAIAIGLSVFVVLASIPLYLWLSTKLLLVPSAIILERATIRGGIGRSWRLVRGRFWVALGVIVVIGLSFGFVGQLASVPFSFLGAGITTIFAPTGDPTAASLFGLVVTLGLTYIVSLLIQAVAIVVQSTASALVYIDCRMRHEGLDIDLLSYVEKRDAGATELPDPWTAHIGRTVAPRPVSPAPPAAYPAGYPPQYGQPMPGQPMPYPGNPAYPQQGAYPPSGPAYPPARSPYPPAGHTDPPRNPPQASPDATVQPTAPGADEDPEAPAPTRWAAPGAPADGTDRESPWA